ncbi:copper homeostasis protein CutC [Sutcliffiella halmapala]|uniref:copper homeostasis protein CutC n=1 Tax=Sutcliffiella halmapala TaxID=79882 RepID=UPI00099551F6|nr:copper homeostasis protein CutC [Sutcliffiella halmapala]
MKLEVIVQNEQEAIAAEKLGADRLELVSAISEGGLTPSYGTIKRVLASVSIPVQVMIRPHSHHFFYDDSDMEIIVEDIRNLLNQGHHRIVFGALNRDYSINEQILQSVLLISNELDITFHRAFDEVASQTEAYQVLTKYKKNVKRILTSGGEQTCGEGQEQLRKLVSLEKKLHGPVILPGSGLNLDNIEKLNQLVGASEYHFGSGVRMKQSFLEGFNQLTFNKLTEWKMNSKGGFL